MNSLALLVGILIAIVIIVRLQQKKEQPSPSFFPILLATFPAYYWVFAIYQNDYQALFHEMLIGLLFIGVAVLAYFLSSVKSLVFLAVGFIGHGIYDVLHHVIWPVSVAPIWWPEFCGIIDIMLGAYVLWLAKLTHKQAIIGQTNTVPK